MTRELVEAMRELERDQGEKYRAGLDWFRIGNFAIALHQELVSWLKPIDAGEFRALVARGIDGMLKGRTYRVYARYNDLRQVVGVTFWLAGSATTPGNQYVFLREMEA